jgi:ssDNA-binding Zn-finger/Zn-ribbon topoisomerase 1
MANQSTQEIGVCPKCGSGDLQYLGLYGGFWCYRCHGCGDDTEIETPCHAARKEQG